MILVVIFVLMQSIVLEQHLANAQKFGFGRQPGFSYCLTNVDCQITGPSPELDCVKNFDTRRPNKWG